MQGVSSVEGALFCFTVNFLRPPLQINTLEEIL